MASTSAWRQALRPAKFRGIAFDARSRSLKGGRQIAEHIYPERDESYPEDLGRKTRRYSVEAICWGPTYMMARDRLVAALEDKGPGEYIDLWGLGRQVVCDSFTVAENIGEGGYCAISMEFIEYSAKALHVVGTDTGYAVNQAASAAEIAAIQDFATAFNVRGNDSLMDSVKDLTDGLVNNVTGLAETPRATLTSVTSPALSLLSTGTRLRTNLLSLAGVPSSLAVTISQLLNVGLSLFAPGWPRYRAARGLASYGTSSFTPYDSGLGQYNAGLARIDGTTPTRQQMAVNQSAFVDLIQRLSSVAAANETTAIDYTVYEDAVIVRDETAVDLDARMLTAPDPVYRTMSDLRATMVRDVTVRGADLARLTDVTPAATVPALVLAHRIYGDATRETDVLSRNTTIRHPGFVPGGTRLRVPVDG